MINLIINLGLNIGYGFAIQKVRDEIIISNFITAGLSIFSERLSVEYSRKMDDKEIFWRDKNIEYEYSEGTSNYMKNLCKEYGCGYIQKMEGVKVGYIHPHKNINFGISIGYYWGSSEKIETIDFGTGNNITIYSKIKKYELGLSILYYFSPIKTAIGFEYTTLKPIGIKIIFK